MTSKFRSIACLLALALLVPLAHAQTAPLGPRGVLNFSTTVVAADTVTLTNNQMVGLLTGTPTAAANYTTPTAAALCAYFRNVVSPVQLNFSWDLYIKNTSAGANAITLVAGSGVTVVGTATVAQNNVKHFTVVLTNCASGSEAASAVSLGTSTF